jgi:hypothetical protein
VCIKKLFHTRNEHTDHGGLKRVVDVGEKGRRRWGRLWGQEVAKAPAAPEVATTDEATSASMEVSRAHGELEQGGASC